MSKDYNIDDILLEIKTKKTKQEQKEQLETEPFSYQPQENPVRKEPAPFQFQWKDDPIETPQEEEKVVIRLPQEEPEEAPVRSSFNQKPSSSAPSMKGFSFDAPLLEEDDFMQEKEPSSPARSAQNLGTFSFGDAFSLDEPDEEAPVGKKPVQEAPKQRFQVTLPEDDADDSALDYDRYFQDLPQKSSEQFQFSQPKESPSLDFMQATRELSIEEEPAPLTHSPAAKEPFRLDFDFDEEIPDSDADLSNLIPDEGNKPSGKSLFPDEMLEDEATEKKKWHHRRKKEEPAQNEPETQEEPEDDSDLDDYTSSKDKESVIRDMKMIKTGLMIRLVLMLVVFGLSLYLALSMTNPAMPLPGFIQPETKLREFMIANTVVAAIGAVICSNTVGGGILSLLKLKSDTDTLPSISVIATLAQGVCFIVKPDLLQMTMSSQDSASYTIITAVSLFFPVAMLILMFNIVGKIMVILRIQNNFKLVASDRSKYSVKMMDREPILREWAKNLDMEERLVAYPAKTKFLSNFLEYSYSEDYAESTYHIVAPVSILAGILISVLTYIFNKNVAVAISTFSATMCICTPLTSTMAANYPMLRLSNKLIPSGAMVAGYSSVAQFSDTEGVVMKASDIFPPENVTLHGIKAFDQSKIDSVILDAASVVCSTDGMLAGVFNKMIGTNKSMLRPVENIAYEDSMGLSAWVDGKRVLIGNRELMIHHGIEVPSMDYEKRYVKDSKNIVYLSNSGELSAMFVISYNPNNQVMDELDKLADNEMCLIVETSDPNITAEKIESAYDFPKEKIQIMPGKTSQQYRELSEEQAQAPAHIGYMGSSKTMIHAICDCMIVKSAIAKGVIIQMAALIIGYGIIAVFSLVGDLGMMSPLHLIAYQLLWGLLTLIIPNLKKL